MLQTFCLDTSGPFRHLITVKRAICVRFYDEFMNMQNLTFTWQFWRFSNMTPIVLVYEREKPVEALKLKFSLLECFSCIYSSNSPQGGKFLIRFSDNFNHAYLNFWSRFRLIVISRTRWSPLCASCCQNMQTVEKKLCASFGLQRHSFSSIAMKQEWRNKSNQCKYRSNFFRCRI